MMKSRWPIIIQGGMGAGVSDWCLARAVAKAGQLGVVSGTALDVLVARRLQLGDPGGHVRRALEHFPFKDIAQRVLSAWFVPGGKPADKPFRPIQMLNLEGPRSAFELCMTANFTEVFLAREGHSNPIGMNYLEKIQLPHLASIYGAILAGVAVIIMGAGIPLELPGILTSLSRHEPTTYPIRLAGGGMADVVRQVFDPRDFGAQSLPEYARPAFFPIVSTDSLAVIMCRKANGPVDGFVIENDLAGGHNAPPRGQMKLNAAGEPIYGPRDKADLDVIRGLNLPFWLAGSYGSPDGVKQALDAGAAGVQIGTIFALCHESALMQNLKHMIIEQALAGTGHVVTDPEASPTGFPFKVIKLPGTLSDPEVYNNRRRVCDLGYLRELYRSADGTYGFRCLAAPNPNMGKPESEWKPLGRHKCLCNALSANVGLSQLLPDGSVERPMVTLGSNLDTVKLFCTKEHPDYTAADAIRILLQKVT